jgi:hypothetical protein
VPTAGRREDTGASATTAAVAAMELVTSEPAARPRLMLAAAALVGVVLGAAGARYLDSRHTVQVAPVAPVAQVAPVAPVDVRVSLAAQAGIMTVVGGEPVVSVPLVLTDAGTQPVTLDSIQVSGPGASLVPDPRGQPSQPMPAVLVPGREVYVRIGLRSDCAVLIRPSPQVVLVVTDLTRHVSHLTITVPDLDSIWGQTLVAGACPATS